MATITVMAWQRALLFVDGRFVRVLEPGRHRYRAVRDATAATTVEQAMTERCGLSEGLTEATAARTDGLGIEVASVVVKDVMLPAELRRAAAETLLAREAGKAALERARGEAAALRTLANAARLLEEHPALLHLRTIQAATTPGATIVLTPDPDRLPPARTATGPQ
jgi:SPFH domain / Band 7 family